MSGFWRSVDTWPFGIGILLHIIYLCAIALTIWAHYKGIIRNCKKWKPKENSSLTYSYFGGTGFYQWQMIYKNILGVIRDKQFFPSVSGAAERLHSMRTPNQLKQFAITLGYYPLKVLSYPDMAFRIVVGYVYVFIVGGIHWLFLAGLYGISMLLLPVWKLTDHSMRVEQHCPHCFATFRLPSYTCPQCGRVHDDLVPGITGLMYARCQCGMFLPATIALGKDKLPACCPSCKHELAASNVREFSILLTGGNTSGKTAYLSAFQHVYRETVNHLINGCSVIGTPKEVFDNLEHMFLSGQTIPSSQITVETYSYIHTLDDESQHNMVIYDIPDEVLLSENYERNPLNFAYADGFLLMFDPLSEARAREMSEKLGETVKDGQYSNDSVEDIMIAFIQQFSRLASRSSSKMVDTPVAVVITKADTKAVKFSLRDSVVRKAFDTDPEKYDNDLEKAKSEVYRNYLIQLGLSNAINNLESVFSNVRYFTTSAMGHFEGKGPFLPKNVIDPIAWIAGEKNCRLAHTLNVVKEYSSSMAD